MDRVEFKGTYGKTGGPIVLRELTKALHEYLTVVQYVLLRSTLSFQLLQPKVFSLW